MSHNVDVDISAQDYKGTPRKLEDLTIEMFIFLLSTGHMC